MSFDPQLIARQIHSQLAQSGIGEVATCMTRLRVTVRNKGQIDIAALKQIAGVLGVVETPDQIQIIIGPGKVNQVYDCFMPYRKSTR